MPRNFYRRIECVFPVQDPEIRKRVLGIIKVYLSDTHNVRHLKPDGSYHSKKPRKGKLPFCAQSSFAEAAKLRQKSLYKKAKRSSEITKDENIKPDLN